MTMAKGIGSEFIEKTKYQCLGESDQSQGLPQPPLEVCCDPKARVIDLPPPRAVQVREVNLREAIDSRESVREYSKAPLSLDELSYLLWATQGVKRVIPRSATLRTVPSAGARHAFETFLLANNVQGLQPGLYRFLASSHKLAEVDLSGGLAERITEGCLGQSYVRASAVTFIWTAVPYRMNWRYGERGYRYLLLDAGHVCQNLYLAADAIDSGVCAIAAYNDDEINSTLGIDGLEQFSIYIATVGKKQQA